MDLLLPAAALAWVTLMGGPIVTLIVARGARQSSVTMQPINAVIVVAIVVSAWFGSIEFAWRPLNWFALTAGYLAWCILVGSAFRLRPRAIGIVTGILGTLSLIPGVLLCTIGILALLFIVGDYASPPDKSVTLKPGLDCVVTGWGAAISDDGHEVHLYRYITWFPLIRYQVRRVIVDETNPTPGIPANTGCREVAAETG